MEDVEKATQLAADKTQVYNEALNKLQQYEQMSGESGKALYESVENGTKSYDNLTRTQQIVYDQYKTMLTAEQEMKEAQKQRIEYSAKWEEQLAKESGDYSQYIATLQEGVNQGIISQEEMYDYFAQTYGKIDADSKKLFVEQLPEYMRESVVQQGEAYETFGNKLVTAFTIIKTKIQEKIQEFINNIKERFYEFVDRIVQIKIAFEELKNKIGEKIDQIKLKIKETWEKIINGMAEGVIRLRESVLKVFNTIINEAKKTWERVVNFFSGKGWKTNEQANNDGSRTVSIAAASFAVGTNYVPNDGLAYLHQGEAVIPKKYNQPYQQGMSTEERLYMQQIMTTMRSLDNTMKQGINVNGEFRQRGSDLVATINKNKSQTGADLLSNVSYAR